MVIDNANIVAQAEYEASMRFAMEQSLLTLRTDDHKRSARLRPTDCQQLDTFVNQGCGDYGLCIICQEAMEVAQVIIRWLQEFWPPAHPAEVQSAAAGANRHC